LYVVEVSGGRVMRAQVGQATPRGRPGPRPRPRPRRERAAARAGRVRGADPGVRVCGGLPVPGCPACVVLQLYSDRQEPYCV